MFREELAGFPQRPCGTLTTDHGEHVSDDATTVAGRLSWLPKQRENENDAECLALVIAWSAAEPERVGEVCLFPEEGEELLLGRGAASEDDPAERMVFARQRPDALLPGPPLKESGLSRSQALLRAVPSGIEIEGIGRCPMSVGGVEIKNGIVRPGECLSLKHQAILFCVKRPCEMSPLQYFDLRRMGAFGVADEHGAVGESAAAWELRDQLAFCAASDKHVLLLGESGVGKELAAAAIHRLSSRGKRAMVSRNAATLPAGLIDAELFGNVKDFPNPGMTARPGIIGEAKESTLFLDEIGELPEEMQAHLLRVLDSGGEYQSLGDARMRRSDIRLVAATNRDPTELKHDLLARLTLRVTLPSLDDKREDVPLLLRHLLRIAAEGNPRVVRRFFDSQRGEPGFARVHPDLVEALVTHAYTHNVRELDMLLWQAIAGSKDRFVALTGDVRKEVKPVQTSEPVRTTEPTEEEIRTCLERNDGSVTRAWQQLGLKSRYALYRLMKKHGIKTSQAGGKDSYS